VGDSPPAEYPNYRCVNWRPVNGVQFPELDAYDIHGLSVMITRSICYDTIQYILGPPGEGCRPLRDYPNKRLSWINELFIDDNEAVRAWLLSNPVL